MKNDILNRLKKFLQYLIDINPDVINKSMNDVHHKGIFSLVINGTENGKLTRVFIADKKLKPYDVQLHSHRYPINITVLKGEVVQYVAKNIKPDDESFILSQFEYKSPLNGGNGLEYISDGFYKIESIPVPVGSIFHMTVNDIHTMSCSKGSIWVVEELGFELDSSIVLGVPFITDDLYKKPEQFQINNKYQEVKKAIQVLINQYNLI